MDEPVPLCACGSRQQVIFALAFDRYLCVECRARKTAQVLGEVVTPLPAGPLESPDAVAFCAPGRKSAAELCIRLHAGRVPEVREHPWLTGLGYAILVACP